MAVTLSGLTIDGRIKAKKLVLAIYATWSLTYNVGQSGPPVFTEGNLRVATNKDARASMDTSTGLRYFEITINSYTGLLPIIGIMKGSVTTFSAKNYLTDVWAWYGSGGKYGAISGAYGTSFTTGDIIGVLVDNEAHTLTFYKNGVSQGVATSSLPSIAFTPYIEAAGGSYPCNLTANFGETAFAYPVVGAQGIYVPA